MTHINVQHQTQGTEKQVEWANRILISYEVEINKLIDSAEQRVAEGNMPQIWADCVQAEADKLANAMRGTKTAAKLIELEVRKITAKNLALDVDKKAQAAYNLARQA